MLGLEYDLCAAFGVTAIHATVRSRRKRFETNTKLATHEVTGEVFEVSWR
jgi:hypothetical protein